MMPSCGVGLHDQLSCDFQFGFGVSWGEQSIVSDSDKALGQDVEQEAADKLVGGEGEESVVSGGGVVSGSEGDFTV